MSQKIYNVVFCIHNLIDVEPPEIQNCPQNIIVYANRGVMSGEASWTVPTALDNIDGTIEATLVEGLPPGSSFEAGPPHTIKYGANDTAGNAAAVCSFHVTTLRKI